MSRLKSLVGLVVAVLALDAVAQSPEIEQRVSLLKASLIESSTAIRQYEWVETTIVAVGGEEKSRQLQRVYYGADGALAKVPLGAPQTEAAPRGLRGRIAEKKKGEMTEKVQRAVALVKQYAPPMPERIEAAKAAGKVAMEILQPGQRIRLSFRDYYLSGDVLALEIDVANNRLLGILVDSYLDDASEPVKLDAAFAQLLDGTMYANAIQLALPASELSVALENSGYRKLAQ